MTKRYEFATQHTYSRSAARAKKPVWPWIVSALFLGVCMVALGSWGQYVAREQQERFREHGVRPFDQELSPKPRSKPQVPTTPAPVAPKTVAPKVSVPRVNGTGFENVEVPNGGKNGPSGVAKPTPQSRPLVRRPEPVPEPAKLDIVEALLPRPAPTPTEIELFAHIRSSLKQDEDSQTSTYGHGGTEYRDVPEQGAMLIGLDVTVFKYFNTDIIGAVRPLYWSVEGTKVGEWHGDVNGTPMRLEAKSGYAVGGIELRAGHGLDNVQLVFMKIIEGGLDVSDQYKSALCGSTDSGGRNYQLLGEGAPIVGIYGESPRRAGDTCGLGFVTVSHKLKPVPPLAIADEDAFFARIAAAVKNGDTVDSDVVGRSQKPFRDVPAKPAVLVGLEVSMGDFAGSDVIGSIRPIYRYRTGIVEGKWTGKSDGRKVRIIAKPGYAVAGLEANVGLTIDSLTVTFMRITAKGLDRNDRYVSQRIGGDGGSSQPMLCGDGSLIVGLHGFAPEDPRRDGCGIGLISIPMSAKPR